MPRRIRPQPKGQVSLFGSNRPEMKRQNDRWIVTATGTIEQLLNATQRVSDDDYGVDSEVQRPLYKRHCEELAKYYAETEGWIVAPFVFTAEASELEIKDGEFESFKDDFAILDGQHRIQALHIVVDRLSASDGDVAKDKLKSLKESAVPLMFIENRGHSDAAQLFVDLNKNKSVTAAERAYLDGRDPVVNAIRDVLDEMQWVKEHTDRSRTNPEKQSEDVWSLSMLQGIVKTIEVGMTGSMTAAKRRAIGTVAGKAECTKNLSDFLDWLTTSRPEYEALTSSDGAPTVADDRERSYAFERNTMILLAHTWNMAAQNGEDLQALAGRVQNLNILKADSSNDFSRRFQLVDERRRMRSISRGPYDEACEQLRGLSSG